MRSSNYNRRRAAYHEAGHFVAALLLGRTMKHITIRPDPDKNNLGHCLPTAYPPWFQPGCCDDLRHRLYVEREAMVRFAGGIAEAKFKGHRRRLGDGEDTRQAFNLLGYLAPDPDELSAYAHWLYLRTRVLLDQEHVWHQVEALAALLLERETLTGRQARLCCRQAFDGFREKPARSA